ncbi:MAG: hypothetical protein WDM76_03805 [Limisphaerales bacterium]
MARIELGAQTYAVKGRFNGKPAALLAVYQLPDSNAHRSGERRKKTHGATRPEFSAGHGICPHAGYHFGRDRRIK